MNRRDQLRRLIVRGSDFTCNYCHRRRPEGDLLIVHDKTVQCDGGDALAPICQDCMDAGVWRTGETE